MDGDRGHRNHPDVGAHEILGNRDQYRRCLRLTTGLVIYDAVGRRDDRCGRRERSSAELRVKCALSFERLGIDEGDNEGELAGLDALTIHNARLGAAYRRRLAGG